MTMTDSVRTTAPTAPPTKGGGIGAATLFALALLAAVAPFGIDLYLSAFPAMTSELSTSATGVQLSLTAFLLGAGVGQVLFGPWSDRAGRMIPLLTGLALFIAASAVAVTAGSIELLVVARLAQGLGGAAGMVIGRAMILDRESGPAAARALNLMMMIGGVAPVVAPLTGSLLADTIGWRGLLSIVGALGLVALAATVLFVRESRPKAVRAAARTGARGSWSGLLRRGYVGHVLAFGFGMAIMMAYISASPFVYQDMIGLSAPQYGLAFAVNAIGLVGATAISSRLTKRYSIRTLTAAGLMISLLAVLAILVLTLAGAAAVWLMVPLFLAIAPLGLVFGNATALALSAVPPAATGAASAFLGLLQFVLAGVVAALVGVGGEATTLPLALTMLGAAVVALVGLAIGRTREEGEPE
ncbi:Bcr/CflA family drug resistance efflux transporter [Microbacterium nanhaiense]|uniref:Bcr/CflA family drug resistance efflux transporter n=2 Tax=Microbacterium nanhaiense TaxID=1301026 RepID=A0ABQ2N3A2_9MICO|nr:Bcr/CflA family drug resistance efflux transporter [Microbacterium nanhaiense]